MLLGAAAGALVLGFAAVETLGHERRLLDPPLHATVEAVGALAAVVMAAFLLQRRHQEYGGTIFLLALAFLGMGLLDVFHAVTVPGHGFVLLHSVGSLVGGWWFALTWLPWCSSDSDAPWKRWMPWAVVAGCALFGIWTLVARGTLPAFLRDGTFTSTAIALNLLAGVFFVAGAIRLLHDFQRIADPQIFWFACMATLFGVANLLFPFSALWDSTWWLWHVLRLAAYVLALTFGIREYYRTVSSLQITLAEHQRTGEEIVRRNRELSVLYTIRRASAQSLDLGEVLNRGVESTLQALGIEGGGIFLLEPDGETMTLRVHRGLSAEFFRATERIKLGEGVSGRAAAEKKPVVLDVADYPSARLAPIVVREGFQTLASAPLLSGGELVGALNLASRRPRAFSPQEVDLLADVGELLGGVAQRARLYGSIQHELAERRRAEEALRETRDYLDNLLNYANAPIIVWDPARKITRFNRAFERLTGYAAGEVVGQDLSVLFPEASRDASLQKIARTASGEYWESVEVPILRKDGEVRLALWNSANVYAQDGVTLVATIAQGVDITERKRGEDRLQDSEARKAAILEAALDCVVAVDEEGDIIEFNSAAERTFGYTRAESIGKRMATLLIPPSQRELHRAGIQRYRATGRSEYLGRTVERSAMRADGTEFPIELSIAPFAAAGGSGFLGVLRDITERTRREEELRASEERYRTVVEHANDWIWTLDRHGGFTFINHQGEVASGYRFEDWKGRSFAPLIHPDDLESVGSAFQKTLAGEPQQYVVRVRKANGEWLVLSVSTAPVRHGDEVVGTVSFGRDITALRTLEDQLRQAQKMEAIGQLAGGIAHDFNNLLTAVVATAGAAAEQLPPDSPTRADLAVISETAERGADLTRKLLAFGRRQRLEIKPLGIAGLVDGVVPILRRLVREDINMRCVLLDHDAVVDADAGAVEQILINLVTNARDAMTDGGNIMIQSERTVLEAVDAADMGYGMPGNYVVLAVTDNGCGMDQATRERVFEPFFTTKAPGSGTGLGMATVYGLVNQHGGFVHIDSAPGVGTTVRVYLPLSAASPLLPGSRLPEVRIGGTETILLAEDEPALRRAAKRVLENHGYHVLAAADGEEALALFAQNAGQISLVMTDVVMPKLGGPELVAELRGRGAPVRVLLTTGYASHGAEGPSALDPTLPVLPKPWTIEELLQRVRQVLDRPV